MHQHTESINTPTNVATRFGNSENVSHTVSNEELVKAIQSIQSGEAEMPVVYEWAFKAMALASHAIGSVNLGSVDEMSSDEARTALDGIELGRARLKTIAPAFDKYPEAAAAIRSHLSALFYAEGTLIPFYMLANKSVASRRAESTSTYIVRHPLTGMIKIGRTTDVPGRIKSLQTGAGAILTTLAVIQDDAEQELHRRFAALRRHGEWFEDVDGAISSFASEQGVSA